jgi:clan AA aspartic protease (TIGR02281 family)
MKFLIPLFFCFIALSRTFAQDIIKMEKSGGIYLIPCKVNGLPLKFIFDTGASDVSISITEALFMLKNGYLKESDIKETVYYSIANGEIAEGTKINIQKIEVGKQTLYNVEASIVHSTEAPLLFGQSAMERFGKFTMDYSNSNLIIGGSSNTSSSNSTNSSTIKSVKIGTQTWMSENLNVDRFRNGDLIPEAKTDEEWKKAGENKQPAWCYYNNAPKNNGYEYGKLYNWYAVNDPRGLAPKGWSIPSKSDYEILLKFLSPNPLKKMKSTDSWFEWVKWEGEWTIFSEGNNESKFNALPGGHRLSYNDGIWSFSDSGVYGFWWTSTKEQEESYQIGIYSDEHYTIYSSDRADGLSLRCIIK